MHVQQVVQLTADIDAVVQGHPCRLVQVDAQGHPSRLPLIFHVDQLQTFAWKFLIPVSLLNIAVTAILKVAL